MLALTAYGGNLAADISVARLLLPLLPPEVQMTASEGTTVAVASGARAVAGGDISVDWQMQVCIWTKA